MTKRTAITTAAFSILALMIAGCVLPSPDNPGDGTPSDEPASGASVDPNPSGTSLEGAFNYDTMKDYVDTVTPWIDDWIKNRWPGMDLPDILFVPHGRSGPSGC